MGRWYGPFARRLYTMHQASSFVSVTMQLCTRQTYEATFSRKSSRAAAAFTTVAGALIEEWTDVAGVPDSVKRTLVKPTLSADKSQVRLFLSVCLSICLSALTRS